MSIFQRLAIFLIRVYQLGVSPLLGSNCRFHPTCSTYASDSVRAFGIFKGTALALRRLSRCHPLSAGGYDPVKRVTPGS